MQRRSFLQATGTGLAALSLPAFARADAYPSRPIQLLVGNGPGSPPDIRAREVAQALAPVLGQQVVVINKPGASGMLTAREVARSKPDGYTLLLISVNHLINEAVDPPATRLPVQENFDLVTSLSGAPLILYRNPNVPVSNMRELVAYARQHPEKLNYATGGNGSIEQLFAAGLFGTAGVSLKEVPYPAATNGIMDVLAGSVHLGFAYPVTIGQHLKAGKLKAIGIGTPERLEAVPDIPTFAEQGTPAPLINAWQGIAVPKGTPAAVVQKLHSALQTTLSAPQLRTKWLADGAVIGGERPDAFETTVKAQQELVSSIVTKYRITRQ